MTKSVAGKNMRLLSSVRLSKCSGTSNNAALTMAPLTIATFCRTRFGRNKKNPIGRTASIATSAKLGFTEASRIELNTSAMP